MVDCRSPIRSLVAVGLAFALVSAACGSPSTSNPPGTAGSSPTAGSLAGSNSLTPGLLAGLGKLDSYQFSWTISAASSAGTPAASSVPWVSGTVINKGTRSYRIDDPSTVQFIVIGDKAWTSIDKGKTWATGDVPSADLTNLMLDTGYATWFDKNAVSFKMAGEGSKNGVQCVRYKGDSSLGGLYAGTGGASSQLTADLWIAKDGNYPVSGNFGYSGSIGGKSGGFGYSFDVTHVNDSANSVAAPTNVLLEPTDAAST
jgi:hypothetical protein